MRKLNKGDKIIFIAPSAQIGCEEKIREGMAYLSSLGLLPTFGKNLFKQNRYMAGSDKERADDVNSAFADNDIKAIFCVRAAAGAARILPYLDYKMIRQHPKPLIGFCDNAALQLALNKKCGLISWNGFLPTYDFKNGTLDSLVKNSFENLLSGKPLSIISGRTLRKGNASGKFLCCNLSTLMKLAGTPYFPNLRNKILLVEDRNERLHKIDSMLQQLKQQTGFSGLKGIIFGQFTDCNGDEEDGTLLDCFNDFICGTDFPAVMDFKFGHIPSRYVLPNGAAANFCAAERLLEIRRY